MVRTVGFGKCKAVVSQQKSRGRRENPLGLEWTHEANNDRPEGALRAS